ncbi:hypothetical protein HMPREF1544_05302 [Mucor circinelloides 1006PhL]|uniref:C2H2-type domain-containing protein n=1 Tax=Mucor circinelloides f. circinelloides (strain 1006PhL) TaxID=1220926 RepID=S2K6V0_MUCC1|nr:hypothetical protein HMPREF1544_05302 [Mucor circinelloides 1006PhL]
MHGLTLQAINPILAFAGFPPINRIQDFNLVGFKQQCLQLEASNKAKTAKQHIFLRYLHTCRKRIHNGVPVNHNPEAKVMLRCQLCGDNSEATFSSRSILENHLHDVHGGDKLPCTFPKCKAAFKTNACLVQHISSAHDPKVRCKHIPCTMTFGRKSGMERHAKRHASMQQRWPCTHPGCDKVYLDQYSLQQHAKKHSAPQKVYDSTATIQVARRISLRILRLHAIRETRITM